MYRYKKMSLTPILDALINILKDFYPHYLMPHPTTEHWVYKNPTYVSIFTERLGDLADQLLFNCGYPTGLISSRSMNNWSIKMTRNVYALTLSDWKTKQEIHDKLVADNPHYEIDPIRPADPDLKEFDTLNVHPWRRPSWHDPEICVINENQDDLQLRRILFFK